MNDLKEHKKIRANAGDSRNAHLRLERWAVEAALTPGGETRGAASYVLRTGWLKRGAHKEWSMSEAVAMYAAEP